MPRYFFNTRIGDELISDPDGEVLRNPDRAWEMARAVFTSSDAGSTRRCQRGSIQVPEIAAPLPVDEVNEVVRILLRLVEEVAGRPVRERAPDRRAVQLVEALGAERRGVEVDLDGFHHGVRWPREPVQRRG